MTILAPMETGMNILLSRYKLCYFSLTMSPAYWVKLKIAQKEPATYCIAFYWTDCSKLSQKVIKCLFLSLLVFWQKGFYIFLGFYQTFIFRLTMVNFYMQTKVRLSWLAMCCSYDVIRLLSKLITWNCGVSIPVSIGGKI